METSLSVRNDAVLRSARRWIIAVYVWQILNLLISYLGMPYIVEYMTNQGSVDSISQTYQYKSYLYLFVRVAFTVMFFITLKAHSNIVLQQFAKILLIAFIMQLVIDSALSPTLSVISNNEITQFFFPALLIFVVLMSYLFIVAYVHLNKSYAMKSNHPEVVTLCILTFINFAFTICSYAFLFIRWHSQMDYDELGTFSSLYSILQTILSFVIPVVYIICWKRLFHTPSDIPDAAETKKISFVPSKVEIGYLVSLLLFTAIVYVALHHFAL